MALHKENSSLIYTPARQSDTHRSVLSEDSPASSAALKARLRQLLENNSDSIRETELREMQEEERYIQALRVQREKIETLRREMAKRDQLLQQLNEELHDSHKDKSETQKLTAALQLSQTQLFEKDNELKEIRGSIKRQVQEYEANIAELRQALMKERNDRKNEGKVSEGKVEELQLMAQEMRLEADKAMRYQKAAEDELSHLQSNEKERERQRAEETKSWKLLEKTLKDQVGELADEKYRLEAQMKELLDHAEGQETRLDKLSDLDALYQSEQQRNEELEDQLQKLQQEVTSLRENNREGKSKAEDECRSLKEELQRAAELVQRQERTIQEMRLRRQEDQNNLILMKDDLKAQSIEAEKATARWRSAQEELKRLKDSLVDFEQANQVLRKENGEMLRQLQALVEKEEQERLERKQWAKVKMDLLSQREDEVSKLSEALETLPGDTKAGRVSPFRRTGMR